MVNHAVLSIGNFFLHFMVHQMGWELAGWASAIHQAPADAVVLSRLIYLDDAAVGRRIKDYIAEVFSASRYHEILAGQLRNAGSDRLPWIRVCQFFLHGFHFLRFDAVAQVAAVSFMPVLFETVVTETDKAFYKFCFCYFHFIYTCSFCSCNFYSRFFLFHNGTEAALHP